MGPPARDVGREAGCDAGHRRWGRRREHEAELGEDRLLGGASTPCPSAIPVAVLCPEEEEERETGEMKNKLTCGPYMLTRARWSFHLPVPHDRSPKR